MKSWFVGTLFLLLFFSGCCSIASLHEREDTFNRLVNKDKQLAKEIFSTSSFDLLGVLKLDSDCKQQTIRLYIEGDGLAWVSRTRLSSNPTPIHPLALQLMLKDKSSCKVYLSRPCQYVNSSMCEKKYWSSARFNERVIQSYMQVLNSIKQRYENHDFKLLGYSGGGAVATLLSAQRTDIQQLITIAGNLDTDAWVTLHGLSALSESLNPAHFINRQLQATPQLHLIADEDRVMPKEVFDSYLQKANYNENIEKRVYKDFTHFSGWVENWEAISQSF